jgi:hypothetical protein
MEFIDLRKDLLYNADVLKRTEVKDYISMNECAKEFGADELHRSVEEVRNFGAGVQTMEREISMRALNEGDELTKLLTHMNVISYGVEQARQGFYSWQHVNDLSRLQRFWQGINDNAQATQQRKQKSIIKDIFGFEVYAEAQFALQQSDFYGKIVKDNDLQVVPWNEFHRSGMLSDTKMVPHGTSLDEIFDIYSNVLRRLEQKCDFKPEFHFMSKERSPMRRNVARG